MIVLEIIKRHYVEFRICKEQRFDASTFLLVLLIELVRSSSLLVARALTTMRRKRAFAMYLIKNR